MIVRPPFRALLLLAGLAAPALAQRYVPPAPPLNTLPPCPTDPKLRKKAIKNDACDPTNVPAPANAAPTPPPDPNAASQRFPFPGGSTAPKPPAQAFPYPGDPAPAAGSATPPAAGNGAAAPNAPGSSDSSSSDSGFSGTYPARPGDPAPASGQKPADTPAANRFPYPGESAPPAPAQGQQPADKNPPPDGPSGSSSSSSSSNAGSSSNPDSSSSSSSSDAANAPKPDDADDPDDPPPPPVRHRNAKAPRPQTDSERVDEDLSIAHFYIQSGNLTGAYLRAQDAVKLQPDYALAHFSLGEAAMKLKKNAEAVKEFQTYLKLEPDGKQAKAAEKALDQLN